MTSSISSRPWTNWPTYANWHLHVVLYGLIAGMLEEAFGKPLDDIEQLRIPVVAPKPTRVALPMFIDVGHDDIKQGIDD